eukprot:12313282-Karenia_brevis.AAC.1
MSVLSSLCPQQTDSSLLQHFSNHAHPIFRIRLPHLLLIVPELQGAMAPYCLPVHLLKMHLCCSHRPLDLCPS